MAKDGAAGSVAKDGASGSAPSSAEAQTQASSRKVVMRIPLLVNHKEILQGDALLWFKKPGPKEDKELRPIDVSSLLKRSVEDGQRRARHVRQRPLPGVDASEQG